MVASAALPAAASFAAFFAASWLHVVTKGVPPGFLGVSCPSMNSSAQPRESDRFWFEESSRTLGRSLGPSTAAHVLPHVHKAKNSRQKCYENASFIGRIRSSWKPQICDGFWRRTRATSGSTEVLRVIFCSQTSVWRAVDAAKTIAVLRPPDAGESIALKILENPSLVAILQRPTI